MDVNFNEIARQQLLGDPRIQSLYPRVLTTKKWGIDRFHVPPVISTGQNANYTRRDYSENKGALPSVRIAPKVVCP